MRGSESFQVGKHSYVPRGWFPPDSMETDASALELSPDFVLCLSPPPVVDLLPLKYPL